MTAQRIEQTALQRLLDVDIRKCNEREDIIWPFEKGEKLSEWWETSGEVRVPPLSTREPTKPNHQVRNLMKGKKAAEAVAALEKRLKSGWKAGKAIR
jgi:hypothetical protein